MNCYQRIVLSLTCCCAMMAAADAQPVKPAIAKSFTVVPLGVRGGLDESNLSSYMVAPAGSSAYIALDAGTLYSGIRKAIEGGVFHTDAAHVLRQYIKAYFISHPHLDHLAGLIINSPDDTAKTIYGMPYTLTVLKDKYFTWESWANFGDAGEKPQLKKYHYAEMSPGEEQAIPQTGMAVRAYPLSHGEPYLSTAFVVRSGDASLIYLGDTGADTVERAGRLHTLWEAAAPLIREGKLKGIFIEVSFPDEQPVRTLFGHLTPRLLMGELEALQALAGPGSLKGFPIVITHRKPSGDQEARIRRQLEAENTAGVKLIFPQQGKQLNL